LLLIAGAYVGLIFAVVTLFFLIMLAVPILIWLTWTHNTNEAEQGMIRERFAAWCACEFATWTGGVSGKEAAIQILLSIAAVSIGMTVFGLVFYGSPQERLSGFCDFIAAQVPSYVHLRLPTIIITGDRNVMISPKINACALAATLPHAQLVILKGVGHMPHHAAPEIVAALIRAGGM
jgi:pimeloyl-ACP methyl ester carboxylesterase